MRISSGPRSGFGIYGMLCTYKNIRNHYPTLLFHQNIISTLPGTSKHLFPQALNQNYWVFTVWDRALWSSFVVFSTSAISILSSFLESSQNSTQNLWFSCPYVENRKKASRSREWGGATSKLPTHFRKRVSQYFNLGDFLWVHIFRYWQKLIYNIESGFAAIILLLSLIS